MAGFGPEDPRALRTAPRHLCLRDLSVSLPSPPGCLLETMSSDTGASPKPRCKRTDGPTCLGAEVSNFHGHDVKINHQLEKSLVHELSYSIKKVTQETATGGPQKESRGDNSRGRCGVCRSGCRQGQDTAWTLGAPKQTNSVRSTQDDLHVSGRKKIP